MKLMTVDIAVFVYMTKLKIIWTEKEETVSLNVIDNI